MEEKKLNEQLINSIFQFSRLMRKEISASSKVAHLSMLQLEILLYLDSKNLAEVNTIAKYFHVNKSTISSHLFRLQTMNLVMRKINKTDHRIANIMLTGKGKKFLAEGIREKNKRMNKMLTYIKPKDKKILLSIISSLWNKLQNKYEK